MVFLFKMGRSGWPLGKQSLTNSRNLAPTLVLTAWFQGGLKKMISLISLNILKETDHVDS